MSDVAVIQKATLYEIADAIIDTTGRTEDFKVRDFPNLIRNEVYGAGYDKGYSDGEANGSSNAVDEAEVNLQSELIAEIKETAESLPDAGGGGGESAEFDYIAYWDEMLGDVYTEVGGGEAYDENGDWIGTYEPTSVLARECFNGRCVLVPQGVQYSGYAYEYYDLIVIPRSIESIVEFAFENAPYCVVVCLAPTPPELGVQGYWSVDGGCSPPIAIYVPDESVDLYKSDTTWAEYSYAIVPLSTFDYSTAFDNYYG